MSKRKEENEGLLAFFEERAQEAAEKVRTQKASRLATSVAKEQLFQNQLLAAMVKVTKDAVVPSKYALKDHSKVRPERHLNLFLSDLHFHSLLDARELPLQYGPVEEARRLAGVIANTIEYKRQYREETVLNVHLLGDIIQGQLHDLRDGAPLAEQCAAAIHLLTQAIARLSEFFPKVMVRCTPGNHGRNKQRHHDRATNQKWDAIETIVYYGIKMGVRNIRNVSVEIPRTPWFAWNSFGTWSFGTHGDGVLNVGGPWSNIDVKRAWAETNKINTSRQYGGRKYKMFVIGHVHFGTSCFIPNGSVLFTNGALIPVDSHANNLGNFDSECGQWLVESVPNHIVGDSRFITVNEHTDKDKVLDSLIIPFTDF